MLREMNPYHVESIANIKEAWARQVDWHAKNYTPERSPLAGDVFPGLRNENLYLPTIKYVRRYESDNRIVDGHTLDHSILGAGYVHDKRLEAAGILSQLPPELRFQIYEHIAYSWSPHTPFPETICRYGDAKVMVARCNRTPMMGPAYDFQASNQTCMSVCGKLCPNDSTFEQKYGCMDYFKQSEWEAVVAAVRVMEKYGIYREMVPLREDRVELENLVENFVDWLWNRVVLDVKFTKAALQKPPNEIVFGHPKLQRFRLEDRVLHSRIRHISITATLKESASNWLLKRVYEPYINKKKREPNSFIQRLKFVTAHLPNLESASVFIPIHPHALSQIRAHRKGRDPNNGFKNMIPWVRTLNKLPIKILNLAVFITPGAAEHDKACRDGMCRTLTRFNQIMPVALTKYVVLNRSEPWRGDQYHGVAELFEDNRLEGLERIRLTGNQDPVLKFSVEKDLSGIGECACQSKSIFA